jgi:dolichol-phosphate mannosyltransferase
MRLFRKGSPAIELSHLPMSGWSQQTVENPRSAASDAGATIRSAAGPSVAGIVECAALKLALVIPTLCEAANIGRALDLARQALDPLHIDYEILVVDDDSEDGTGDVVSAIAEADPRVRLIVRKGERGLSGAVLDGWSHTDADVLGVMDADLQHPAELLPDLYAAMARGSDLAIGSRYTPGGELGGWNPMRKLLSAAAVWVTWPLQRRRLRAKDPMSGFFLVRRSAVEKIEFQRAGFKLLLEILVRARLASVEEIPFIFGSRFRGASKANFRVAWDYGRLLARLYAGKYGLRRSRAVSA